MSPDTSSGGGAAPRGTPAYDVIYDGDCGICEASRYYGERLDWLGLFRWRPSQDDAVLREHPHLAREALDSALHVVGRGRTLSGFEAVRFIALRCPLSFLAGAAMHLPGAGVPGRFAYRWVADHRRTVLACRLGEPTIVHRALASVFICAVLAVLAAGPVLRREDWPLSCVPMFATPVEPDGARYSFRFAAVAPGGRDREIPADACGVPELRLERILFGRFYGSVDPAYEHGAFPGDTPAEFEKRMSGFFRKFGEEALLRGSVPADTRGFRLYAVREAAGKLERREVGTADCETWTFRRPR